MNSATFWFDDALHLFLPRRQRHKIVIKTFSWRGSIKDMIESMGVPHCEINLLVVNGRSVYFDYIVRDGDDIAVYADDAHVELKRKRELRPPLDVHDIRFVLDAHLGRLAAYLRMLGFDTLYRNDFDDEELALISATENRVLLTRDVGLLKRGIVTYGYFVREVRPQRRLREIIVRYNLSQAIIPFKYCMKCNGELVRADKADVIEHVSADTASFYDEFHLCQDCKQVYWKGPHYHKMVSFIDDVMKTQS